MNHQLAHLVTGAALVAVGRAERPRTRVACAALAGVGFWSCHRHHHRPH